MKLVTGCTTGQPLTIALFDPVRAWCLPCTVSSSCTSLTYSYKLSGDRRWTRMAALVEEGIVDFLFHDGM